MKARIAARKALEAANCQQTHLGKNDSGEMFISKCSEINRVHIFTCMSYMRMNIQTYVYTYVCTYI